MRRREFRALRLEPFEDRLVPAPMAANFPPLRSPDAVARFEFTAAAAAADFAPDRDAAPAVRPAWADAADRMDEKLIDKAVAASDPTGIAGLAIGRTDGTDGSAATPVPSPAAMRVARFAELVATAAAPPQPVSVAVPAAAGQAVSAGGTGIAVPVMTKPADAGTIVTDAPRAAADATPVGLTFQGGVSVPDATGEIPPPPPSAAESADPGTPSAAPSTREVVDRVIEAIFPSVVPLAGAVPLDTAAVDAAVALLDQLPGLGADATEGWESPERWVWVTAGVLVAGGAAVAARGSRGRDRSAAAVPGAASALARWEDRCANELV